jgi:hypothetical protein
MPSEQRLVAAEVEVAVVVASRVVHEQPRSSSKSKMRLKATMLWMVVTSRQTSRKTMWAQEQTSQKSQKSLISATMKLLETNSLLVRLFDWREWSIRIEDNR